MIPTPSVESLFALFPGSEPPPCEPISADDMPEPYRGLLVHTHHMTVTVERFYGGPVDVRVMRTTTSGDEYARQILLTTRDTNQVAQFGLVQIDLSLLSDKVRAEIVGGQTPLGRVLIENGVLRHILPAGYLRVAPCEQTQVWFGLSEPAATYGRLGVIFTDGKPAIEVLEILAPIRASGGT